jgi:CHRD domain
VKNARVKLAIAAVVVGALTVGAAAVATGGGHKIKEKLTGYEEVPALSTPGSGEFKAFVNRSGEEIRYRLSYSGTESPVTQAHIHFENATNNGGVVAFLCTNLGNAPAGSDPPACPPDGGTVTGTLDAADVGPGAADQGIAAGEFDELVDAIRAGATYVNVHSEDRPGGEIRAQLSLGRSH